MSTVYPLHVGDILRIIPSPGGRGPVRLLQIDEIDADGQARGSAIDPDGCAARQLYTHREWGDVLVACGLHEDCRAHLDLAMACAEQRRATHQVGEGERNG